MIKIVNILKEAKVKAPDYIISNTPASKIEPTRIALADVSLGLKMAEELKNWTLQINHYSLVHHNGKVALKLTPKGKLAIKVRSEENPDYLKLLQTTINRLIKQYADKLRKDESIDKSDKLAFLMNEIIENFDNSISYKDFIMMVGNVLKEECDSQTYFLFIQELKNENKNISKLSTYLPNDTNPILERLTISIKNLIDDLVPRDIQNATNPQQQERRTAFIRDLIKTLNQFYKQNNVDWRFADSNIKFKTYSKK